MTFGVSTSQALFLFDQEMVSYLGSLRSRATSLHAFAAQLRSDGLSDARRGQLADKLAELETGFASEYRRYVGQFVPYLKLGEHQHHSPHGNAPASAATTSSRADWSEIC